MAREKKTLVENFRIATLAAAKENTMSAKKMTPKEKLVETVIAEMKKGISEGRIFQPFDFEGWEKYRKRISRMPSYSIQGHLSSIRNGRYTG